MDSEKVKIYVWPDGFWLYDWEVDDIDLITETFKRSDDYFAMEVNSEADYDDVDDIVNFRLNLRHAAAQQTDNEKLIKSLKLILDKLEYPAVYLDNDAMLTRLLRSSGEAYGMLKVLIQQIKGGK
jgi:hypothetical protein